MEATYRSVVDTGGGMQTSISPFLQHEGHLMVTFNGKFACLAKTNGMARGRAIAGVYYLQLEVFQSQPNHPGTRANVKTRRIFIHFLA